MKQFAISFHEERTDWFYEIGDPRKKTRKQQIRDEFNKLEKNMKEYAYRNVSIFFPEAEWLPRKRYFHIAENYFTRMERMRLEKPDNILMMKTLRCVFNYLLFVL